MASLIAQTTPKARKNHICDACWTLRNYLTPTGNPLTFGEMRAVAIAKQNGWKILKGQTYVRQFNTDGSGEVWTFKAIPAILNICDKYKLYDEY